MGKFKDLDIMLQEIESNVVAIKESAESIRKWAASYPNEEADHEAYKNEEIERDDQEDERNKEIFSKIKSILIEVSRDGRTLEVRELIAKYGAEKLSAVHEHDYKSLLKDAKELKDAK